MSEKLSIIRTSIPSYELTDIAQTIGLAAWQSRMPYRGEDISHTFNPDNKENSAKLFERMREKSGRFVGVVAYLGEKAVGYSLAHDDMSGNPIEQFIKKHKGRKPYAWIAQINVLPYYQYQGVGNLLAKTVLEPFDDDQKPTAYVFGENNLTLNWFKNRNFAHRPSEPVIKYDYFGEQAEPVEQYRLEAPSVKSTLSVLNDIAITSRFELEITEKQ